MSDNAKFILDVVPLTKIPLIQNQSFSYLGEKKLPAGTLVNAPLFRRDISGIVIGTRADFPRIGNIVLKKINKVIEESFLTEKQIELAKFISDYYVCPLGTVMKNFVPARVKSRTYNVSGIRCKKKYIKLTPEQNKAVEVIYSNYTSYIIHDTKYLLFGPASSGKTEVYIHSILKLKEKDNHLQFLILLPEKTLTPQAIERYGQNFKSEETVVLNSNVPKGQFYTNWQKIRSGEAKIIIGTRMAVFAPFKKLGLVVIDEEQDISFKQWDMNPRYDARTVAEKLAEMYQCPLIRGSATPNVETYWRAMNKEIKLIKLPLLSQNVLNIKYNVSSINVDKKIDHTSYIMPSTIIVDMRRERWQKNYSPISKKLQGEIGYALKNKLQTILFINRQGMSSFSICAHCRTVLRCPKCDRALVYDTAGHYRCLHCSYKTSIIPHCIRCNGITFQNLGLGTQKMEKEVLNLFSQARVERVDSQTSRKTDFQEEMYREFSNGKIDILIGTQMISKGWDLPNVALVGIIDADNLLGKPDFNIQERCYQNLVQISGRVSRPGAKFPGRVIIQTFQPENKIFQMAAQRDFKSFYNQEIKERKALKLPPFGRLIKLTFQEYNFKRVELEAERVYKALQLVSGITVTSPQDSFVSKIRGRFRKQIVIKFKQEIIPDLRRALTMLSSGWIVDVDPISLI